jgi:hypothetical protein
VPKADDEPNPEEEEEEEEEAGGAPNPPVDANPPLGAPNPAPELPAAGVPPNAIAGVDPNGDTV